LPPLDEGRWTVQTLKEHFEQRFADQKEAVAAALAAAEKAVGKAEANAEKWRENANEWRGSMMDREVKFAAKDQMETEFRAIRGEINSLKETRAAISGGRTVQSDQRANIAALAAIVGLIGLVAGWFLRH